MKILLKYLILIITFSCQNESKESTIEQWKDEIIETEKKFADMASSDGLKEAFLFYADANAVLERNNVLHQGKQSIAELFEKNSTPSINVTLTWTPDFVDVSNAGDLGYTYGKYQYISTDSLGNKQESEGVFHTVWKRQKDGSWKYVWD